MKVLKEGLNVFQLIAGQTEKMFQDFWDFMETFQFTFERLWRKNPRHPVTSAIVCWRILTSSSKTKYNSYWHSVTCVIHVDKDVYDLVSSWFLGSPPSLDNYIQYVVQHYLFTSLLGHCGCYLEPSRNVKMETTEADTSSVSVSLWFVLKQVHSSTVCVLLEFLFV